VDYSTANASLSDTTHPIPTLKLAVPQAMFSVRLAYLPAVNVWYFGVVSKEDILDGRTSVSALFFKNSWGEAVDKVSVFLLACMEVTSC
jgi:hypothetical protein